MTEHAARDRSQRRWTLAAAVLGSALWFMDTSAVSILVPVIQRDFGTTITAVQWVVEAQILFLAALLLLGGALADRFGRRRVFTAGVLLYGGASVVAGFAPTVWWLVGARALQGVGAALLVPGSLALITTTWPAGERGKAFGVWTAMTGVSTAGGPVLAGWLADTFTWRAFFLLFVPYALIVALVLTRVPESKSEEARRLDPVGAALATLGLGGLTFGFLEVNRFGWGSPLVVGGLALGLGALAGFVAWEWRAPHPMMPLDMFRRRNFSAANGVTLFVYAALSGALFFIPLNLVQVQGYSAFRAGLAPLPFHALMAALSPFAGKLGDRVGTRWPMAAGALVTAGAYLAFARLGFAGSRSFTTIEVHGHAVSVAAYWLSFFPAFVLLGVGMAVFVPNVTATVMNAAPRDRTGVASGVNNAVARASGLIAIAVFGVIAVNVFTSALPDAARDALGEDVEKLAAAEVPEGAEGVPADVVDAAFLQAFRVLMLVSAGLVAAGAVTAALAVRSRNGSG